MFTSWKERVFVFIIVQCVLAVIAIFYFAHRDDTYLQSECESKGGTFVQTLKPKSICVKTIKLYGK